MPTKSKKSSNSCSPNEDAYVGNDLDDSDDGNSAGIRSPTPSSAPSNKRPPGRKTEKLKKVGDSTYKESLDTMMATRKELAAERKDFKTTRWL